MASTSLWPRFQKYFLRYDDLGFSIDISRMRFADEFFDRMKPLIVKAFTAMRELETGAIANPDEQRMVGHYWLRDSKLAPTPELRADIDDTNTRIKQFAAEVHAGKIAPEKGDRFKHLLLVGIGGSALGPQFISDALGQADDSLSIYFLDNTDPDGFDRVLARIGDHVAHTLTVVISKSGGTKETRNGMLEAAAADEKAGLNFGKHAVAVIRVGSALDKHAGKTRWLTP